jgi:hypothetical protein
MVKKTTERFLGSNLQYCLHATVLLAVKYLAELTKNITASKTVACKNQGTFQWFFSPFKLALEKSTLSLVEKRNPSNLELHP